MRNFIHKNFSKLLRVTMMAKHARIFRKCSTSAMPNAKRMPNHSSQRSSHTHIIEFQWYRNASQKKIASIYSVCCTWKQNTIYRSTPWAPPATPQSNKLYNNNNHAVCSVSFYCLWYSQQFVRMVKAAAHRWRCANCAGPDRQIENIQHFLYLWQHLTLQVNCVWLVAVDASNRLHENSVWNWEFISKFFVTSAENQLSSSHLLWITTQTFHEVRDEHKAHTIYTI